MMNNSCSGAMRVLYFCVCFLIFQLAAIQSASSAAGISDEFTSIECLYTRRVVSYGNGLEKGTDLCITSNNEPGLDLPDGLIDRRAVVSGQSTVRIHGAKIKRDVRKVAVRDNATVELIGNRRQLDPVTTNGTHIVLVIRLSALDGRVNYNRSRLGDLLFAEDGVTLKTVYEKCSFGKMKIVPYDGPGVVNGVAEMFYNRTVRGQGPTYIDFDVEIEAQRLYGMPNYAYHHLLIMLPGGTLYPGMDPWYAYSYVGHYKSVFNYDWSGYVSAHVHEVGHTLYLQHSGRRKLSNGQDGTEYDDVTGMMGYSVPSFGSPAKCFNGHKNSILGWYTDRKLEITPSSLPWTGNLVTFVDYDKSYDNETVLIKINDLYLQYNRAKSFNSETAENKDEITITQGAGPNSISYGVDSLSMLKTRYTILNYQNSKNLLIDVCWQQNVSANGRADLFRVSIHLASDPSGCIDISQTNQPPSPTKSPTLAPSSSQPTSLRPSLRPTPKPTKRRKPTKRPTTAPTTQPTTAPPSNKPTLRRPTHKPTRRRVPTNRPT